MKTKHGIVTILCLLDLFPLLIICTGTELPFSPVPLSVTDKGGNVTAMQLKSLFSYYYSDTNSDALLRLSNGDTIGLTTELMMTTDTNTSNDAPTESPDVIDTAVALKSLYTFVAVLGSVLMAIFLLICIYFYRTRPPKIPENMSTDELWPDSDRIQKIHDIYFSNQSPYCVNPIYDDNFEEQTDSHVRKKNKQGETVCRIHQPIPTLSTKCCSGNSNWPLPLVGSPKRNKLYTDNVCALSYKKTEYYVDDLSGDGSDV